MNESPFRWKDRYWLVVAVGLAGLCFLSMIPHVSFLLNMALAGGIVWYGYHRFQRTRAVEEGARAAVLELGFERRRHFDKGKPNYSYDEISDSFQGIFDGESVFLNSVRRFGRRSFSAWMVSATLTPRFAQLFRIERYGMGKTHHPKIPEECTVFAANDAWVARWIDGLPPPTLEALNRLLRRNSATVTEHELSCFVDDIDTRGTAAIRDALVDLVAAVRLLSSSAR